MAITLRVMVVVLIALLKRDLSVIHKSSQLPAIVPLNWSTKLSQSSRSKALTQQWSNWNWKTNFTTYFQSTNVSSNQFQSILNSKLSFGCPPTIKSPLMTYKWLNLTHKKSWLWSLTLIRPYKTLMLKSISITVKLSTLTIHKKFSLYSKGQINLSDMKMEYPSFRIWAPEWWLQL